MSEWSLDTLPEGWAWTTIGEVFEINPPRPDLSSLSDNVEVTFVPMGAVDDVTGKITHPQVRQIHEVITGFTAFREGDVIMAKITPCMENGKAAIATDLLHGVAFGSTEFHVLRSMESVTAMYLFYFIRQPAFRKAAETKMTGTGGLKRVPAKYLEGHPFPLPPLGEQKRIVAKLDAAMQEARTAHAELGTGFASVSRFRQNSLVEAVSEGLEVELGELVEDVRYGTSQKCTPEPTGVPVLRIPNVADGMINLTELKYGPLSPPELSRLELRQGDLLMIRSNGSPSLVGRTALIGEKGVGMAFAGYLIRIRTHPGKLLPGYLHLAMQSEPVRKQIEAPLRSTSGVNNINISELKALRICLPSLVRQQEILQRYQDMLLQAETLEAPLFATRAEAEVTIQNALDRAFRGELVPTEASLARAENRSYEDAVALLGRIRAELEQRQTEPRQKAKPRPKTMKLTPEKLKETIQAMPDNTFTFADLRGKIATGYDELQEVLFRVLDEKPPMLRQTFDKQRKRMEFRRTAP